MLIRCKGRPAFLLVMAIFLLSAGGCQSSEQGSEIAAQQTSAAPPAATEVQQEEGSGAQDQSAATATLEASPVPDVLPPTLTAIPSAAADTATPVPATNTNTPTAIPSPTPTPTVEPTNTPQPTPTEIPMLTPLPAWLSYLNQFRAMANLPPLTDQEAVTVGSQLHSRYMVGNDAPYAHYEEKSKPYFDPAGDQAARNGNIFATNDTDGNYLWSINFWVSAPFHLIGLLNPDLRVVGYGDYKEEVGDTQMAAVLDIHSQLSKANQGFDYPIMFPGDGSSTWVVRHSMVEWPYPFDGCPGYAPPTGAPIVLLLGDGSKTPNVISHRLSTGGQVLDSCVIDETSYRNNDSYEESVGRGILDRSDAVVIMPRNPLAVDQTYMVQVNVDGDTYAWSFNTQRRPE